MNPSEWFTEQHADAGSAFSLKIKKSCTRSNPSFNTLKSTKPKLSVI